MKDRTCLLQQTWSHKLLPAAVYNNPPDLDNLVKFVNEKCDTFFTKHGSLDSTGKASVRLLSSLYHVPGDITLKQLADNCASLKQFWYNGKCEKLSPPGYCMIDAKAESQKTLIEDCGNEQEKTLSIPKCDVHYGVPSREEFFTKYLSKSKPVVFKNLVARWPAITKWSNDFFRRKYSHRKVHIKLTPIAGDFEGVEAREGWVKTGTDPYHGIPSDVLEQLVDKDLVTVRPDGVEMTVGEFLDLVEKKSANSSQVAAYMEYTALNEFVNGNQLFVTCLLVCDRYVTFILSLFLLLIAVLVVV